MRMEASSLILQGSTELVTLVCMDTVPQEQQTTGSRGLGLLLGKNWWAVHSLRGDGTRLGGNVTGGQEGPIAKDLQFGNLHFL